MNLLTIRQCYNHNCRINQYSYASYCLFDLLLFSFVEDEAQSSSLSSVGRLRFENFEMEKVLSNSTHLMGSEGNEFDMEEDSSLGIDVKEKMAKQRQLLNARLGLDNLSKIGIDVSGLFSNEDLIVSSPDPNSTKNGNNSRVIKDYLIKIYMLFNKMLFA